MHRGAVNIGEHNSFAVTTNRVSQKVSQSCLSVWDVVSLSVWQSKNHLLQVRKRLVDVSGFFQLPSRGASLLGSLGTSEIYQMEFRVDHLFCGFNSWSRLNMECVDRMGPWRMRVELMSSVCSIDLSLEQLIEGIFFVLTDVHRHILNCHSTSHVVLNRQLLGLDSDVLRWNQ